MLASSTAKSMRNGVQALRSWIVLQHPTTYGAGPISLPRQCRSVSHIVHRIYAHPRDGQAEHLKGLAWKRLRDASQDKLRIVDGRGKEQVLPFAEVQQLLAPCRYLEKLDEQRDSKPTYRIANIPSIREKTQIDRNKHGHKGGKPIKFLRAGRVKEIYLTSQADVGTYRVALMRSINHINDGCRVEMHVAVITKERNKKDIDTLMDESPHLRPEIVMKSMPEGTSMRYGPLFDKKNGGLIWVMNDERKWPRSRKTIGWRESPKAPPNSRALRILENLPVIEEHAPPP
ncbi:MAG: hypothetical protein L6R39_002782 [Caloplaca ligustica]|nr:MAG: hypothetical protein L6R39_002782 [Caloplaca ligustica]